MISLLGSLLGFGPSVLCLTDSSLNLSLGKLFFFTEDGEPLIPGVVGKPVSKANRQQTAKS